MLILLISPEHTPSKRNAIPYTQFSASVLFFQSVAIKEIKTDKFKIQINLAEKLYQLTQIFQCVLDL